MLLSAVLKYLMRLLIGGLGWIILFMVGIAWFTGMF